MPNYKDASALAAWTPAQAVDALQKLCHDLLAVKGIGEKLLDKLKGVLAL